MPTRLFTDEDAQSFRDRGIDPTPYIGKELEVASDEEISTLGAVKRRVLGRAGEIAGSGAGMMAGAALGEMYGAPFGPIGMVAGPIIGGIAGGTGGGYAGRKAQEAILPADLQARLQSESQQAEEQHPYISGATDLTADMLAGGMRPSISNLGKSVRGLVKPGLLGEDARLAKAGYEKLLSDAGQTAIGDKEALKKVATMAILNPAIQSGLSVIQGQGVPSASELGKSALGGALFSEQSGLGKMVHNKLTGQVEPVEPASEPLAREEQSDLATKSELTTPFTEYDANGQLKISNAKIHRLFDDANLKPKVDANTPEGQAALDTWSEATKGLSVQEKREWLHQRELTKKVEVKDGSEPLATVKSEPVVRIPDPVVKPLVREAALLHPEETSRGVNETLDTKLVDKALTPIDAEIMAEPSQLQVERDAALANRPPTVAEQASKTLADAQLAKLRAERAQRTTAIEGETPEQRLERFRIEGATLQNVQKKAMKQSAFANKNALAPIDGVAPVTPLAKVKRVKGLSKIEQNVLTNWAKTQPIEALVAKRDHHAQMGDAKNKRIVEILNGEIEAKGKVVEQPAVAPVVAEPVAKVPVVAEPVITPKPSEPAIIVHRDKPERTMKVRKDDDFDVTGEYVVTDGVNADNIYQDPDTGAWYSANDHAVAYKNGVEAEPLSALKRSEAIEKLKERWAKSEEGKVGEEAPATKVELTPEQKANRLSKAEEDKLRGMELTSNPNETSSTTPLPDKLAADIESKKATTGSVLDHLIEAGNKPDSHPILKGLSELASALKNLSNRFDLAVPWSARDSAEGSAYGPYRDSVEIGRNDLKKVTVLLEEAFHSIGSRKLPAEFSEHSGQALYNKLQEYLKTGDNVGVKKLIQAWLKVAEHRGLTEELFGVNGLAGKAEKFSQKGTTDVDRSIRYAMGNLDEFMAHAFRNRDFQEYLNTIPSPEPSKSMWKYIVDAVGKMIGLDVKQGYMLAHVLENSAEVISGKRKVEWDLAIGDRTIGAQRERKTETDSSKHGFLDLLASSFDKVRKVSVPLSDAFHRMRARTDEFTGLGNTVLKELSKYKKSDIDLVTALHREAYRTRADELSRPLTPDQQKISKTLSDYYGTIADKRVNLDMDVQGKNQFYVPDQLNERVLNTFRKKAGSPEAIYLENKWVDHVVKESKGAVSEDEARKNIQSYIAAMGKSSGNYRSLEFGAIRKAAGYGLPEGLRELDGTKSLAKYAPRAAKDLAMYMELETKPEIAGALQIKDPRTGRIPHSPDKRLADSQEVRNAMSWVTGGYRNETSEVANKISGFSRLVNSSIMGAGTGLRDTASVPVMAIPYIKSFGDFKSFFTGIMNYRKEAADALRTGAYQPNIDKIQFNESVNKMDSLLSIAATNMRKWQGREAIENFNRKIVFAGGKELMRANVIGARGGNKNSLRTIERFSTLVDGDVTKMKGEELEAALNQMAKNFTDVNQGTYGGSGLPLGIVDSQFAPFTALSKWSVEKSNVIYKDVVKPALKGETFVPLITYSLGTIMTGAAIQQLNEILTNRKASDPTIKEALDKGSASSIVSELATIAQLASFGGIIGDLAKAATDAGLHGKTPRNVVSFPAATAAVDVTEKTIDLAEAIRQGEDVWEVFSKYSLDMISHNIQNARMIANHTVKEGDVERSDKFRDMRVYNELEGGRASDIPTSNQYLGLAEKAFKQEQDPVAAMRQLPALINKFIADSNGDPFELKSKLAGLKGNNYQTMPDMKNAPLSFMRYLQFLKNTQGEKAANERLMDYIRHNAVNKAKSSAF